MKRKSLVGHFFLAFVLAGAAFAERAEAQEYVLGANIGGLGLTEGDASGVAYGPFFRVNPLGWAAFEADATFSRLSGENYFSSSPSIVLYPLATDEFGVGFVFGPGFYKIPGQDMKFGLSAGITGDFVVGKYLSVGMETRYYSIFQSVDAWGVFVKVGFRFEGSNDW